MIRLYLNHFTTQIGSQLKMIDQITLIGQGNTVGSLPGSLYVKYGKTGIITVAKRAVFRIIRLGVFSALLIQAKNFSCRIPTFSTTSFSTFFSTRKATSFKANSRN